MVTGGPRKRFVGARIYRGDSWPRNRRTYSSPRLRFVAWKNMSQRGIRGFTEKNRFDTNGTPYLLVATKRESSPRKGNRRHEKTIVAAKRESSPRKDNRRREKRIVATKENRGTNNGGTPYLFPHAHAVMWERACACTEGQTRSATAECN